MENKKYTILVTAAGGDIGQAIVKILRRWEAAGKIIGTDMSSDSADKVGADSFYVVPKADDPEYLKILGGILDKEKVDFAIPVSEPELRVFSSAEPDKFGAVKIVFPRGEALPACLDKFETIQFLKNRQLPAPWTILAKDGLPSEFPCIMKDRWSWGSKNFSVIEDLEAARFFAKRRPNAIFQEKLLPAEEEYTCGIFRSSGGDIQTVILRRTLAGGLTGKAVVVEDKEIGNLCRKVAEALDLRGSINLQLIKTKNGPMPFEINPRFSSTAIFRDAIGFKDVVWSLLDLAGEKLNLSFIPPVGTRFYRIYDEIIIPPKI